MKRLGVTLSLLLFLCLAGCRQYPQPCYAPQPCCSPCGTVGGQPATYAPPTQTVIAAPCCR